MPLITRPLPQNFDYQLVARDALGFGYGVDNVHVVTVGIAADFYGVAHLGHRPVSGDLALWLVSNQRRELQREVLAAGIWDAVSAPLRDCLRSGIANASKFYRSAKIVYELVFIHTFIKAWFNSAGQGSFHV